MSTETITADYLIAESVATNEIVHFSWTAELAEALEMECDDTVAHRHGVNEYWGHNGWGDWRVHLHLTETEDETVDG